nr:MAG TPA: hypothetical protein [Crassvirales sp.]
MTSAPMKLENPNVAEYFVFSAIFYVPTAILLV